MQHVIFLGEGDAVRAPMAAAVLNRLGDGRFAARSGGSNPAALPNPDLLRFLSRHRHNVAQLHPQDIVGALTSGPPAVALISLTPQPIPARVPAGWPQPLLLHWPLPDLLGSGHSTCLTLARIYRILTLRLSILVSLPDGALAAMARPPGGPAPKMEAPAA